MIFSLFDEISFQRNETTLDTFKIAKWFVADDNDNLTLLRFSEIIIFMINW